MVVSPRKLCNGIFIVWSNTHRQLKTHRNYRSTTAENTDQVAGFLCPFDGGADGHLFRRLCTSMPGGGFQVLPGPEITTMFRKWYKKAIGCQQELSVAVSGEMGGTICGCLK
jgi:hypothetical protein